ncbi:cell division protein FtsQ/DivIB [Cohnella hongkongensis]|uniref:Cell division protein DivIB n=1 Tax=Cohnella hongkongensis TaxID=178337 RepID=A0ABV9FBW0_9BACL
MTERIPALKKETEPPRTRRGKKLLGLLIALAAILVVVLFFRSPLSKISEIQVNGSEFVSREEIVQALGVSAGDSFFFPGIGKLKQRVEELKPVESVLIVKSFPGVVRVEVKEHAHVAVRLSADGSLSAILSNGLVLPMPEGKLPDKPILSGWQADDENLAELCKALSDLPGYLLSDLSEIQPDPSVSYPKRIKLFTRSRFEVTTSIDLLKDKIAYLSDIVQNREPGKITMLDVDYYLPYSAENVAE